MTGYHWQVPIFLSFICLIAETSLYHAECLYLSQLLIKKAFPLNHLCCPSLNFLHCAVLYWGAWGWSQPSRYFSLVLNRGKEALLLTSWRGQVALSIFDVRAHCWLMVSLPTRTLRSHLASRLYWYLVFLHRSRSLHFLLVSFLVFCCFISLLRFLLMAAQPSDVLTTSGFALSLLLMEVLNNIVSHIDS